MTTPATKPAAPSAATPLLTVLGDTIEAARAADRDDLVVRLEAAAQRVSDPRRRIVVTGQRQQGKSRFVNALLGLDVCRVGDDVTTAIPMQLEYGATPSAELVLTAPGASEVRVQVPFEEIGNIDANSPYAQGRQIARIEAKVPNQLLSEGIVLIDTPGIGGHGSSFSATVLSMVPSADAVLLLSDASTELTEPELAFLRQVRELCPTVAVLLTKIDMYPHWRQVAQADKAHIAKAGLQVPFLPVSSLLRSHALRLNNAQLGRESGFGMLFGFLKDQVVARDQVSARAAVARELHSAAEHLALALGSELLALSDPESGDAAIRELQNARTVAEDLRRNSGYWQQTLSDGIADLMNDIDHDLRERLRAVAHTAEDWIDDHDPSKHWPAIAEWLTGTVDTALGDNLLWTHTRAETLAETVAEHFGKASAIDLPDVDKAMDSDHASSAKVGTLGGLEPDIGVTSKVLVGLRGSYGGVLMVGLASTLAGLALLNPLSIGAGILVGGKAYKDDKGQRLQRKRLEAKAAVRRFVDDVAFHAGKETKDRLNRIHRALRDHYTGVAERSLRSINASLHAAQEAANSAVSSRAARREILEHQLVRAAELRRYADGMLELGTPTPRQRTYTAPSAGVRPVGV
ncbi:isoniazid-inducible protein iniA [Nocardia camponoti]|uniref:Isoniazid-inducible protein iniA n=1 Tax=Nocardia camponoti TaxID=1616106 RepID=A0A917V9A9_9NOCA|nr:dynamin family protein [Nocardia camponoti]GGK52529.1 isoniazid-inducible protein iniA [Nocardia camponoti]